MTEQTADDRSSCWTEVVSISRPMRRSGSEISDDGVETGLPDSIQDLIIPIRDLADRIAESLGLPLWIQAYMVVDDFVIRSRIRLEPMDMEQNRTNVLVISAVLYIQAHLQTLMAEAGFPMKGGISVGRYNARACSGYDAAFGCAQDLLEKDKLPFIVIDEPARTSYTSSLRESGLVGHNPRFYFGIGGMLYLDYLFAQEDMSDLLRGNDACRCIPEPRFPIYEHEVWIIRSVEMNRESFVSDAGLKEAYHRIIRYHNCLVEVGKSGHVIDEALLDEPDQDLDSASTD